MIMVMEVAGVLAVEKLIEKGFAKIILDTAQIKFQLKKLESSIKNIDTKLDDIKTQIYEQTLEKCRVANQSLIDFINATKPSIKETQFNKALGNFTELIALDPSQTTKGTSGEFDNKDLISYGYIGRFYCFHLEGDKVNTAIAVYQYVDKWVKWCKPLSDLKMFPPEFFSKDYKRLFEDIEQQHLNTKKHLEKKLEEEKLNIIGQTTFYNVKRGLKAVGAASIVGMGMSLAALGKVSGAATAGTQAAKKILEIQVTPPYFKEIEDLKSNILQLETKQNLLRNELAQECQQNQKVLQQSTFQLIFSLTELIDEAGHLLPSSEQARLKTQKAKLQTGLFQQNDRNYLKQTLKETGELIEGLSSVLSKTADFVNKIEKSKKALEAVSKEK